MYPEVGYFDNALNQITTLGSGGVYTDTHIGGGTATTDLKYKFVGGGHGATKSNIATSGIDKEADVTGTLWPYANNTTIECTTCHDVHNNDYAPFLRAPLSDNTTAANSFCLKCHKGTDGAGAGRWVLITTAPNGSHPVEMDNSLSSTRDANDAFTRNNRSINFVDVRVDNNAVFRNVSPGESPLNDKNISYNPGGKLGNFGLTGKVGCYTCHPVHLPGASANMPSHTNVRWRAADGTFATNAQNDMCVGCHNNPAGTPNFNNPGMTPYYHPVGNETYPTGTPGEFLVSTKSFKIMVNTTNLSLGVNNRLLCSSCHMDRSATSRAVHNAAAGTFIMNTANKLCGSCHDSATRYNATRDNPPGWPASLTNAHHVWGGTTDYTAAAEGGYADNVTFNPANPRAFANLKDGLQCNDCHNINGTAHNW